MPSRPNRASGIRTRVPGVASRPLEEAGISLGKHSEDWMMPCLRGPGYLQLWGGATEEPEFLLAEEVHEGGLVRGRNARGGRRDEALEEADWEMSAGGGSRERDCAGRAVAAERGCGVGLPGGLAGSADGCVGAKVKVLAIGEAGMLRLKFCWEVTFRQA